MLYRSILEKEIKVVYWGKMENISELKHVPFGLYAMTKPIFETPTVFPWELEDTTYFGQAGYAYDGYSHDKKSEEYSFKAGRIYERLDGHRYKMSNDWRPRFGGSYKVWHDKYGKDSLKDIRICVMVPTRQLKDDEIKIWLLSHENNMIYEYYENFGKRPEMNLAHSVEIVKALIKEDSFANIKKLETKEINSLRKYMNG